MIIYNTIFWTTAGVQTTLVGVPSMMAYTGKVHLKGVPFLGFRYLK